MTKNKHIHLWFIAGLVAALLSAPNGIFIKLGGDAMDPLVFNSLRFIVITLVTLPYVMYVRKKFTKKNMKYALLMGLCMTVAAMSYVGAISLSQASYVAIIALGMPIVFILYSISMTGERIRSRSVAGISLAIIGAFIVVAWPLIAGGSVGNYSIWATVLAVVDVLVFPLAIIFSRKANEHGLPVMASFGVSSIVVAAISTTLAVMFVGVNSYAAALNPQSIIAVLYSGVAVALVARLLNVMSYERLGSVVTAGLSYVENLLAILLPLLILGEFITFELVAGGLLILVGVYIAETQHHSKKHRHIRVMQHR
jgi:drug/metabolite transporter (DMT)-like permease